MISIRGNDVSLMAVFTLEDVQGVWTDKSSRTNKSSNMRLMCKRVEQIFQRTNRLKFVSLERRFFPDDLSRRDKQVDDSST